MNLKTYLTVATASLGAFALAQGTPPNPLDFNTSLTAVQGDLGEFITTNGPSLLGIVVIMGVFVFVVRWVRKLAKGG